MGLYLCKLVAPLTQKIVIFAFGQSWLMSPARVGVEPTHVGYTQQNGKGTRPH